MHTLLHCVQPKPAARNSHLIAGSRDHPAPASAASASRRCCACKSRASVTSTLLSVCAAAVGPNKLSREERDPEIDPSEAEIDPSLDCERPRRRHNFSNRGLNRYLGAWSRVWVRCRCTVLILNKGRSRPFTHKICKMRRMYQAYVAGSGRLDRRSALCQRSAWLRRRLFAGDLSATEAGAPGCPLSSGVPVHEGRQSACLSLPI